MEESEVEDKEGPVYGDENCSRKSSNQAGILRPAKYLVVDSNAFIHGADISRLGDKIYTIPEVIEEIKDQAALKKLSLLHFDLNVISADSASIRKIISMAKKSGDYYSLSLTDIKLLALLYNLGCEHLGENSVNLKVDFVAGSISVNRPNKSQRKGDHGSTDFQDGVNNMKDAGVDCKSSDDVNSDGINSSVPCKTVDGAGVRQTVISKTLTDKEDKFCSVTKLENSIKDDLLDPKCSLEGNEVLKLSQEMSSLDLDLLDDDASWKTVKPRRRDIREHANMEWFNPMDFERWITPDNLDETLAGRSVEPALRYKDAARDVAYNTNVMEPKTVRVTEDSKATVACCTSDYAIQNLVLLMQLGLVSPDGKLITRVRTYVLRCYGCYTVTRDFTKIFCPRCGGNTLLRVTAEIDSDANLKLYLKENFEYRIRGTIYPIGLPRSGRHSNNLILREGQREYVMAKRKKVIYKPPELTDYAQIVEPLKFPPKIIVGYGKLNPNEVSRRIPRRKK